jgi:alkyl sulfatase BDS1-like metallo-beta-lactamase superfamily hydrolase
MRSANKRNRLSGEWLAWCQTKERLGQQLREPDLTLTINRADLEQLMMGKKTLEAQIADGTAKIDGDAGVLQKLAATTVEFDPRFEITPGTKSVPEREQLDAYEAVPRQSIAE